MLKEQKNNVYLWSLVVILTISLATPMVKADPSLFDIDWIAMTWYETNLDGAAGEYPWSFEIWVDVVDPGSLDHIDITKPGGTALTTLTADVDNYWEWESGGYSDLGALTATATDYEFGRYKFDFYDAGGDSIGTWYAPDPGILAADMSLVDFTNPSVNGQTGISTSPTLTWTWTDSDGGNALMMGVSGVDDDYDYYEAPVSTGTNSLAPGPLTAGHEYDLEVSVLNVYGLVESESGPLFPTETVSGDNFKYSIMTERLNEIKFTVVPVPGAVLLGMIGMGVAGLKLRKFA